MLKAVLKYLLLGAGCRGWDLLGDFNQTGRCCGEVPNIYSMVFHYSWKMELELQKKEVYPNKCFFTV